MKSFLGKEYDSLFVVDLFCHGVPSNRLFMDHVAYLEEFYKSKIVRYSFRDKYYGWDSYNNTIVLDNGNRESRWINQAYYSFFVKNVSLRPACYSCQYRGFNRPSDITIGDFWGVDKILNQKNDNTGVSLVLVHTSKGMEMINECAKKARLDEVDWETVQRFIHTNPIKCRLSVEHFWNDYQKGGYQSLINNFFDNSFRNRLRFWLRKNWKRTKLLFVSK